MITKITDDLFEDRNMVENIESFNLRRLPNEIAALKEKLAKLEAWLAAANALKDE